MGIVSLLKGNQVLIDLQQPAQESVSKAPDIIVFHREYRPDHAGPGLSHPMVGKVFKGTNCEPYVAVDFFLFDDYIWSFREAEHIRLNQDRRLHIAAGPSRLTDLLKCVGLEDYTGLLPNLTYASLIDVSVPILLAAPRKGIMA